MSPLVHPYAADEQVSQLAERIESMCDGEDYDRDDMQALQEILRRQSLLIAWLVYNLIESNPRALEQLDQETAAYLKTGQRPY